MIEHKVNVNVEDNNKHTALSYCLDMLSKHDVNFYDATKKLLQGGANVNYIGKYTNRSFLHYAAASGNFKMVMELIEERNAHAFLMDLKGKTPLDYADDNGHMEIANYLNMKMAEAGQALNG